MGRELIWARRSGTIAVMVAGCLGTWVAVRAQPGAASTVDATKLAPIFGNPVPWNFTERKGGGSGVGEAGGRPYFAADKFPVTLASQTPLQGDAEITVRFRIIPHEKVTASLNLQTAITDPADAKERGLYITLTNKNDNNAVSWSTIDVNAAPGVRPYRNAAYRVGFNATRSLGWPDDLRRQVEADMAAAEKVGDHWFNLRVVVRNERVEYFLDTVPLFMSKKSGLKTDGYVRLALSPQVQLASLQIRKLAPEAATSLYQPVGLDALLNSNKVDGKRLDTATLRGAEGEIKVGNVPFTLAAPNARGNDHVDVGVSMLRQGNLEGGFGGDRDAFGGRWAGASERDPNRLQVRVPGGRYRALHLLAVADREADSVPIVTAQFFRNSAGFPESFASPKVPLGNAAPTTVTAVPVALEGGGKTMLYDIAIPINPGDLAAYSDRDYIDLELTKQIQLYRAYPDPMYYSFHGAGLPSSVHVYAATLERATTEVELQADAYGHVWTAPLKPRYTVKLRNNAGAARPVTVTLATTSLWGNKTTRQTQTVRLGADGESVTANIKIDPPCYGYHSVNLTVTDGKQTWEEKRSLAFLHEDTRERGDWDFGRGPIFGFWNWAGGHGTPNCEKHLLVMGQAGAETTHGSFYQDGASKYDEATLKTAERYGIKTFKFAGAGDHYTTGRFAGDLKAKGLEAARDEFLKTLRTRQAPADAYNRPIFLSYYAEPSIGNFTHAVMPDYYGEPVPPYTAAEEDRYKTFENGFIEGAKIVRANFPGVKNLMPHGDPNFPVPFLRRNPEIAKLIDGTTVDIPCFERLPEQQIHQVAVHRMFESRNEFRKAGIEKPILAMYEGPCIPSGPGAMSEREQADLSVRNALILLGYGVDFQTGGFPGFDCTSAWGEQHYGFGVFHRIPIETPKPSYAAYATMTRLLNRCNYDGYAQTGSLTVFAQRYKHYKNGKIVYAMWTVRGCRPVTIALPAGATVSVTDAMDNSTVLQARDGQVTFTVDTSPCYVTGLTADVKIGLGEPDHSDAAPAALKQKLTNFGDGSWKISTARDANYEGSHTPHIVRFPGKMTSAVETAPATVGGKALAVHLDKQEIDRTVMPYYTTLMPAKPIPIPGKASHLGLWVKAASDWGRVVYFVRDAKGELWISVGKSGAWNCDDLHSDAQFNFDGSRYLRFELPAHSPYDSFREVGTSWWGAYSSGDNIVDLPLSLEKVIVERRSKAMYVNDLQPARPDDVLLGDLFAEYATPQDQTPEAIRLAALRMPVPVGVPDLDNPIADMEANPLPPPPPITNITLPEQMADGTRCYVHFGKVEGAVTYDIWASPYESGKGALKVGTGWKEPGGLVRGLRPDTDFYLFLTYADKDGKASKPTNGFKIRLQDLFAQK